MTGAYGPRHLKSKWDLIRIQISNARESKMHRVVYSKRSRSFRIPHIFPSRAKPARFRIGTPDCIGGTELTNRPSRAIG